MAARRAALGASTAALRDRLSPEPAIAAGATRVQNFGGQVLTALQGNPAAVALTVAGVAWLILGKRPAAPAVTPQFEAMSRWEDEGGNPHPEYDSPAEEISQREPSKGKPTGPTVLERMRQTVEDYPYPLGMVALALGGVLAARLPGTEIERAMVADAKAQIRETARSLIDAGRARVEAAAADLKEILREDLHTAGKHVAEAFDKAASPAD